MGNVPRNLVEQSLSAGLAFDVDIEDASDPAPEILCVYGATTVYGSQVFSPANGARHRGIPEGAEVTPHFDSLVFSAVLILGD